MKLKGLKVKIMLGGSVILIATMVILTGIINYFSSTALTASTNEAAEAMAANYASQASAQIDGILMHLQAAADASEIQNGAEAERIIGVLGDAAKRTGRIEHANYIYPDGHAISSSRKTFELGQREYFIKVKETKKPYASKVLISAATKKPAVVLCAPVLKNGEFKGIVTGTYSLDKMTGLIENIRYQKSGYGFIVDEAGMVIVHAKRPELVGAVNLLKEQSGDGKVSLDGKLTALYQQVQSSNAPAVGDYLSQEQVFGAAAVPVPVAGDKAWTMFITAPEEETLEALSTLNRIMIGITIVCLLASCIVIFFFSNQLTRPVREMRDKILELAKGNLGVEQFSYTGNDEIGELSSSLNNMLVNLRKLIRNVQDSAEQLAASSEELTASAEQSSTVTTQIAENIGSVSEASSLQLAAVEKTSGAIERISSSVTGATQDAEESSAQADQAVGRAQDGSRSIEKAVRQMTTIETTVTDSARVVGALGERSKEIGQIVETISGIAGQTNLLALNAAIEAARAGEQGKGFAVVAEEVRKLAEQSQEAAERISGLISSIQIETEKAVVAMDAGTKEVKTGTEVVNEAGISFSEISEMAVSVSKRVRSIADTMQGIADETSGIVESVRNIDSSSQRVASEAETVAAATQQQSASMHEISASSKSLAQLAQELQTAARRFKL